MASWLVSEHDDAVFRLTKQVLELVPANRRRERVGDGNSLDWTLFHIARHASLGLRVVGHEPAMSELLLADADLAAATAPDAGLQESEQPWFAALDTPTVEAYSLSVLDEVRAVLGRLDSESIERPLDVSGALARAGIDHGEYDWLIRQWNAPGFVFRWVLVGHVTFHSGEAAGVRSQLGLSPFR